MEKRIIFQDDADYAKYISILKNALSPPQSHNAILISVSFKGSTFKGVARQPKNFHTMLELHAYGLMPNHFHLLVKQKNATTIKEFMQSILTRYSMYFNLKYRRTGHLFSGVYKASLITDEPYLLHLSRYIHRNPMALGIPIRDGHTSYPFYCARQDTSWLNTNEVLSFFERNRFPDAMHANSYEKFVEYDKIDSASLLDPDLERSDL